MNNSRGISIYFSVISSAREIEKELLYLAFNWYIIIRSVYFLLNRISMCCVDLFQEPVRRILALTETCLVERDPASYNIVTIKPFGEVSHC